MTDFVDSDLVTVSSADHNKAVLDAFRSLFDSKRGTDFAFSWGGITSRAHRLVLEVFLGPEILEAVRNEQLVPAVKMEVLDEGDDSRNLDSLLEFLYKGEVAVQEERLEGLLLLARELNFQMLVDALVGPFAGLKRRRDISPANCNVGENQALATAEQAPSMLKPSTENISTDGEDCLGFPWSPDLNCEVENGQLRWDLLVNKIKVEPEEKPFATESESAVLAPEDSNVAFGSGNLQIWRQRPSIDCGATFTEDGRGSCQIYTESGEGRVISDEFTTERLQTTSPQKCDGVKVNVRSTPSTKIAGITPLSDAHRLPVSHTFVKEMPFRCPHMCVTSFGWKWELERHLNIAHCFQPNTPEGGMSTSRRYAAHAGTPLSNLTNPALCKSGRITPGKQCAPPIVTGNNLAPKNDSDLDLGVEWFACKTCGKRYQLHSELVKHKIIHNTAGGLLAPSNPVLDNGPSLLRQHLMAPISPNGIKLSRRCAPSVAAGNSSVPKNLAYVDRDLGAKWVACKACGKVFRSQFELVNHKRIHVPAISNPVFRNVPSHLKRHGSAPALPSGKRCTSILVKINSVGRKVATEMDRNTGIKWLGWKSYRKRRKSHFELVKDNKIFAPAGVISNPENRISPLLLRRSESGEATLKQLQSPTGNTDNYLVPKNTHCIIGVACNANGSSLQTSFDLPKQNRLHVPAIASNPTNLKCHKGPQFFKRRDRIRTSPRLAAKSNPGLESSTSVDVGIPTTLE